MLVAVDFPAGGFAKISDFFPCDLSKWNFGKNFRFVKFKIFEWKLVLSLIFADDFFEIFHSWIFKNSPGGISFSDKLGGIAGDFIFRVRHFFWEKSKFHSRFCQSEENRCWGAEFFLMKFVDFWGKEGNES